MYVEKSSRNRREFSKIRENQFQLEFRVIFGEFLSPKHSEIA